MFADAEQRKVPSAVLSRIGRDGVRGDNATPDIAVKTTRVVNRAFDRARYALRRGEMEERDSMKSGMGL